MTTKATQPLIVKVKKEPATDEIKDFAANAMNELLGWYGYESVDRNELMRCAASRANNNNNSTADATTRSNGCGNQQQQQQQQPHQQRLVMTTTSTSSNSTTSTIMTTPSALASPLSTAPMLGNRLPTTNCSTISSSPSPTMAAASSHSSASTHNPPTARSRNRAGGTTSTPDRCPAASSPELNTTNSSSRKSQSPALRVADEKKDVECGWCKRPVSLGSPEFLATPEGPRYCSESCFSQSRRASFKRAKTCDWCKHVRHAVSYVDFQDGASQLQFCSDKCLNQYKMQIFCRETQAHLDQHPHLKETGKLGNDGSLITPDLWLRNCKSRSLSPASDRSPSRSPTLHTGRCQPVAATSTIVAPHRPLITLAPSSKLLSRPNLQAAAAAVAATTPPLPTRVSPRAARKRRSTRHAPSSTSNDQSPPMLNGSLTAAATPAGAPLAIPATPATAAPTLQDLTTNAQHRNIAGHLLSPMLDTATNPNQMPGYHHPHQQQQFMTPAPNLYPMRGTATSSTPAAAMGALPPPPPASAQMLEMLHRAMSAQPANSFASGSQHSNNNFPGFPHPHQLFPPPVLPHPSSSPPNNNADIPRFFGSTAAPPITIMVPYPVLVPVPIPVPIPMPIVAFLRAAQLKLDADKNNKCDSNSQRVVTSDRRAALPQAGTSADDQPLDFTKSRELCAEDDPELLIEVVCEDDDGDEMADDDNGLKQPHPDSRDKDGRVETPAANDVGCQNEMMTTNRPIPKLKITRLNSRRGFITPSDPSANRDQPEANREPDDSRELAVGGNESSPPQPPPTAAIAANATAVSAATSSETGRPLRKRKRLVDCDYSRFREEERRRPLALATTGGNGAPK